MQSYVYWVYNESCKDYLTEGYIGVTSYIENRMKYHFKHNPSIPKDKSLSYKILFKGTRGECFTKEEELRPKAGIGWNRAKGGAHGWKENFIHSDGAKEKMRAAWTDDRKDALRERMLEHNKKMRGQKRPKQSKAVSGSNNGMYGNTHTDQARMKISEAHKGKIAPNRIEMYCIGCHEKVNPTTLKKYHGKCFK